VHPSLDLRYIDRQQPGRLSLPMRVYRPAPSLFRWLSGIRYVRPPPPQFKIVTPLVPFGLIAHESWSDLRVNLNFTLSIVVSSPDACFSFRRLCVTRFSEAVNPKEVTQVRPIVSEVSSPWLGKKSRLSPHSLGGQRTTFFLVSSPRYDFLVEGEGGR